ncbi:hypothetical protein [Actinospica robiniae]|uniref:hypothetical protein n=1 Tax=Actinospica robiniae TaxID=304901 RepID=UPI0012F7BDB8|nr:hypothetical protein [Actinospica robiniae]
MNGPLTIPDLLHKLASRHAAAEAEIADLREQVAKLSGELAAAECERDRWASTRETILALAGEHQAAPAVLTEHR